MTMRLKLASTAALMALCLLFAAPAGAADSAGPQLKAAIDALLNQLDASTHGQLKWEGSDRMAIHEEGDAAIAEITNARFSIHAPVDKPAATLAHLTLGHVEIRRAPGPDGTSKLSIALPSESILDTPDHGQTKITLKDATASAIVDGQSGMVRASTLAYAGARIDDKPTGDWVTFGPLTASSKIAAAANGGWTGPIAFEQKEIEFFATQGPASGAIDRIAYTALSSGPDLAAFNRLRQQLAALRQKNLSPPARLDATLDLLPGILSLFTMAKGELTLEGLVVRAPTGKPLVAIKKASLGGALTGLSGEAAALRVTFAQDGLNLAPNLIDPDKVPQRATVDIALEDVATGPLRTLLEAAGKLRQGTKPADKQQAEQQALGAAAMLNPTLRLYDLSIATPAVGIDATGVAKGSPLSPKGYTAAGDVAVRGFDALGELAGHAPPAAYLPLLKELGTPATADDGSPRLKFHLASTPQKPITLNGSDISAWFAPNHPMPGRPRLLRPAEPAMTGTDVSAVQQALAAAHIAAPQNGAYDGATAAAVARFQKANDLNVNGVADAATRLKLGLKPGPDERDGPGHGRSRAGGN